MKPANPRRRRRKVMREKTCRLCENKIFQIDFKDVELLKRYTTEGGKILPRRITGTSNKYQKKVSQAIKRARHIALMPYVADCLK